jgi:hypothetical protein
MSTTRLQELQICFGKQKQTDIQTANTAVQMWQLRKLNAQLPGNAVAKVRDSQLQYRVPRMRIEQRVRKRHFRIFFKLNHALARPRGQNCGDNGQRSCDYGEYFGSQQHRKC